MPDTKISALTVIGAIAGGDKVAVADASDLSESKAATIDQIADYLIKRIAGASGAAGPYITWQRLTADSADITTTTPTGIMSTTGLGLGKYRVRYTILYQSSATGTGVGFVLFNDVALFHQNLWYHVTTGGAAATGVGDNDTGTVAGQMMEGKSEAAPAAGTVIGSFSAGVAVANQTIMAILEAVFAIDDPTDGQLDLRMASETGSAVRAMTGTCMELQKIG